MYTDATYGDNWAPTASARRINPYSRSCAALGGLFVIGTVVVIVAVLSLIPLYISRKSSSSNTGNVQVAKLTVNGYVLNFLSPSTDFNEQTILSNSNNTQALQAALTAILQNDPTTAGSVIEINTTTPTNSRRRRRRQSSTMLSITFNFSVIGGTLCSTNTCLNQFQTHTTNLLTNVNATMDQVWYQQPISNNNSTPTVYWLRYQLPKIFKSDATLVYIDLKTISSLLNTLTMVDQTKNLPWSNGLRTSTPNIIG